MLRSVFHAFEQGQVEGCGKILERFTTCAAVLDLVVDLLDFGSQPLGRQLIAQFGSDLLQRPLLARLDLRHAQDYVGEAAFDHGRNGVLGEGESGVGDLLVDQALFGDEAEVGIGGFGTSCLGDIVERLPGRDFFRCRFGLGLVGEAELLDAAAFDHGETAGVLIVGRFHICVADRDRLLDRVGR